MGKYNKEELEKLILIDKLSYELIGRQFDCSGSNIKKVALRLGIQIESRRKINEVETFNKGTGKKKFCLNCGEDISNRYQNKYCNSQCQREYEYKQYILDWQNKEKSGTKGKVQVSGYIRRYLFDKFNSKCEICNWGETNKYSNSIPLEIHHKDGDCTNNREENLSLLCPCCHSLTNTYRGLNSGIGNDTRYKLNKQN